MEGNVDEEDARGSQESPNYRTVARMPVDRDPDYYNMNHKNRGMALIFNHEYFDIPLKLKPRTGTNVDCNQLIKVFKGLGFQVTARNDLILTDLLKYIEEASKADHSNSDCIVICVLTHGNLGKLYARDTHYKLDNLWNDFTADKCPFLAGKPKLFFIQACQGVNYDAGVTLSNRMETDGSNVTTYNIPIYADFLIASSTVPGYVSARNTIQGSWFMQALTKDLQEYATKIDILTLLTFVLQKVALNFESNTPKNPKSHQKKQVPCITSMLTRLLVFGKKK